MGVGIPTYCNVENMDGRSQIIHILYDIENTKFVTAKISPSRHRLVFSDNIARLLTCRHSSASSLKIGEFGYHAFLSKLTRAEESITSTARKMSKMLIKKQESNIWCFIF